MPMATSPFRLYYWFRESSSVNVPLEERWIWCESPLSSFFLFYRHALELANAEKRGECSRRPTSGGFSVIDGYGLQKAEFF
jgi:hypothetical protein